MRGEKNEMGKLLIYQNEKGDTKVDVFFAEETVWMTQRSIAELYQTSPQNVTSHIKNIYKDFELDEKATCKDFLQVQNEGGRKVRRERKFYNLEVILAVGYRVRSNVGIHFRKWASSILTEFMKKGFVLNDERLKNPKPFGADYFDELLERIRDIRASEKRVYQKVKDIFALSVDYNKQSDTAQKFFKLVQNKLEFAATGYTAPEIIASRADATKENMGLTAFKGAKVRKSDVLIAKNYMTHEEISTLNLIVNMYLDYAELQAKNHRVMHMTEWEEKLNQFLQFNGREVLQDFGKVRRDVADALAYEQYEIYNAHRKIREAVDVEELIDDIKKLKP
jgi:hypothetical protein